MNVSSLFSILKVYPTEWNWNIGFLVNWQNKLADGPTIKIQGYRGFFMEMVKTRTPLPKADKPLLKE